MWVRLPPPALFPDSASTDPEMLPNRGGIRRVIPLVPLTAQGLADYSSEEKQPLGNNLVPNIKCWVGHSGKIPSPKRKAYKLATMFRTAFQTKTDLFLF